MPTVNAANEIKSDSAYDSPRTVTLSESNAEGMMVTHSLTALARYRIKKCLVYTNGDGVRTLLYRHFQLDE
jgi:hypothetical protein